MDSRLSDPRKIVTEPHLKWGHASAQHVRRALADSDRDNMHFATCVGEVPERREVCRALDRAPRAPAARASTAARFNEKLRVDLLFFDDIIAVGAMDVCSKYSLLILVRTRNLTEVCGAFRNPGFGVFGPPRCVQMDGGQNFVRDEDLNYLFKVLARTPGFLSAAMVLRAEFIIA